MLELVLTCQGPNVRGEDRSADALVITHFPCVVGRASGCDHHVNDLRISRRHCVLSVREGQVWVEDLQSRNGTCLNGSRLPAARPLRDGDQLDLAHLSFRARLRQSPAEASEPARQVLVVEDDVDVAQTLALLLEGWGRSVRVAHNGPQALRAARDLRPDDVLLDIHLPGMDGHEVASRLRTEAGLDHANFVAVTGDQTNNPGRHEGGQFDHVLLKPVEPEALRAVLSNLD